MIKIAIIDGIGVYGNFFHYAIVIALVGSAFMIFLYLWKKKRLDMDESPKFQMMQDDTQQGEERCPKKEKIK